MLPKREKLVAWFKEIDKDDVSLVGGKGANLGEITNVGLPVPNGFIITSTAYYNFIKENNLSTKIKHLLNTVNFNHQQSLNQVSRHIKEVIKKGVISQELANQVHTAYRQLGGPLKDMLVAVRSSATAEDLAGASFAGQQETFLNVKGDAALLEKIKEGWASLFEPRAIFYRHEQHYDHLKVGIALVIEKMIESEKSGIMFTIDPVNNDKSKIIIEAIYGLGEMIVQGEVTPDHYEVAKSDLKILNKSISQQTKALERKKGKNREVKISRWKSKKQKISDKEIIELAKLGKKLEQHYYFPQDSEWAIEKRKIYLVQTRPVTTIQSKKQEKTTERTIVIDEKNVILKGDPASPGIACGPAKVIHSASEIGKVLSGDILVAPQTNPDFVPAMKKAVAIVTDSGGRTSHAAIVSRELGIPAVVGTGRATKELKTGIVITVDGLKGEVYKGGSKGTYLTSSVVDSNLKTATRVYANLAEPEFAEKIAQRNVDGVGLLRAEFMMAGIGIHPKKMIKDGKKKEYVKRLAEGIEKFCQAFYPRPVVYRASDFKTNEYRLLKGGHDYEPLESNPMLGYRGAFRYINDPSVFQLELDAIKYLREKKGYKNLWLMLPFVRTVEELEKVKKLISDSELRRSPTFKLWMMVEIPSNVILLPKFIDCGIDGVSVGSNDLTMLILGTDRDNDEVATEFDERNDAVLWAFEHIIKTCHKYHITSSVCGQSVSTYPDLVEKLVNWGVTSVSVSPDAIDTVRETIHDVEKKIIS